MSNDKKKIYTRDRETPPPTPGDRMASDFWRSYESRVHPHHFAAVKSSMTGKPETVHDHRYAVPGESHGLDFIQNGGLSTNGETGAELKEEGPHFDRRGKGKFLVEHAIPHLQGHAKKVQNAIMGDQKLYKKMIGGKPHVLLHRGVGGSYASKIASAVGYDPESHSVEDKNVSLRKTPFTSWTSNKEIAEGFAKRNSRDSDDAGSKANHLIMSKWIPVDQILHSGYHSIHEGQNHSPYAAEEELVVGHPEGKENFHAADFHFHNKHGKDWGPTEPFIRPKTAKVEKSENIEPLIKSPTTTGAAVSDAMAENSIARPPSFLKHMYTQELTNGLFHHHFANKESGAVSHTLSLYQDPNKPHVAEIAGHQDENGPAMTVGTARVSPTHRGKGYGKMAYMAALHHHGRIMSDSSTSKKADQAWKELPKVSNGAVDVRIMPKNTKEPHAAYVKDKKVLGNLLYGHKLEKSYKWHSKAEMLVLQKPFRSKAQRGYLYSHPEKIGGKEALKEWEKHTPKNIPKKINKADKIPGGLAENKKPSDFDKNKLKEGTKVEMEHTSDKQIAQEIAQDHLTEDPNYYQKLKTIEKSDIKNAVKGGIIALGLMNAQHYIDSTHKDQEPEIKQPQEISATQNTGQQEDPAETFLKGISQIESSGGKNLAHKTLHGGIHSGTAAIGTYGFMPHTVKEIADRADKLSQLPKDMAEYKNLSSNRIQEELSKNPQHEAFFANFLANHLLHRFGGDQEKAAYAWNQGHNIPSYRFDLVDYKNHPYVKKFREAVQSLSKQPVSHNNLRK